MIRLSRACYKNEIFIGWNAEPIAERGGAGRGLERPGAESRRR
jgi:hypothetical protein